MRRFMTLKQSIAIGVLMLGFSTLANAQHADDHQHDLTTPTEPQPSTTGIINSTCPVTTDEEVDPAFTIEYEGQTIGFCCRKCRTRFDEDPDGYLAELPMLKPVSLTTAQESAHDESEPHGHEETTAGDPADGATSEHDEGEEHDHATDHDQAESGLGKLISWIGKFHPPTTHIPIGMLIGAALAEGLFILTKRELFRNAGTFCVVIAGFGAIGAVTLGWFNGGFTLTDDQWVQTVHRWLGTSTALLTLLTIAMLIRTNKDSAPASSRLWYRVSLFAAAGMVGATGFFGGALVYGLNHYAW